MVAHLNVHTSYDLLNSSIKIKDVIAKATKEGYIISNYRYKCFIWLSPILRRVHSSKYSSNIWYDNLSHRWFSFS